MVSFYGCSKDDDDDPTAPFVTTTSVSDINQTSAQSGGNVTSDGEASVTGKGVCWNTSENPTTSNSKTSDGNGVGPFTSSLTQLVPGTKYYVRAYAINEAGTGYGNQVSFTSEQISLATVTTSAVTSLTGTTAVSGGNISSDGGGQITARGVCWGKLENPTTSDAKTTDGTGSGSFVSNIAGLDITTEYHVRAYAISNAGTSYGDDITFTTLGGPPSASTYSAYDITSSGSSFAGYVDPNSLSTVVTFEYGTTISYGQTVTADESPLADVSGVTADVTGLSVATIYHYRVKAVNAEGTTYGDDITFTTLGGPPNASTYNAYDITSTGSSFAGYVEPNFSSTVVTFEYGTTTSYGQTVTADESPLADTSGVTADVTGLSVSTIYHYRVKAVNALGTTYGDDVVFTTLDP